MIFLKYFKRLTLTLLILHLIFLPCLNVTAGNILNIPSAEFMLQNSNMGTKFFVAVPQNDTKNGQDDELLSFYICSYTDTRVKFLHHGLNLEKNRDIKAFEPLVLSTDNADASFSWEITESEVVGTHGIEISSEDPIAVYVLNSRVASSDGYLAIPTEAWGKKYIHCGYYDHRENNLRRGGGFIILSSRDGTNVTIELKGIGGDYGKTVGGKTIGTTFNVNLNEGDTYMVRGDASTSLGFDLSGTTITANHPVGVISFHQRTMIPNNCPNGRVHLSEMFVPVQSWGKEFVTLAFDRGMQGDLIRIVASENGTRVQGTSYELSVGNVLEYFDKQLNAGEFFEHLNSSCSNNNKQTGVRGVTVWKATKPVMLMQYSYSFPWDGDQRWDPLMVLIPPIEQFKKSIVFQPAVESNFIRNQLTFFAVGNPYDSEKKLLNSIFLNNEKLTKTYQMYLHNRIPNTNIYWGRTDISQDIHNLTSDTKIAGYINGFSGFNTYAWPLLVGTDKIDQLDTMPPEISIDKSDCGNFTINTYEQRSIYTDPIPQIDQGIRRIMLFKEVSYNYSLELYKPDNFNPEKGIYEQKFFLNIIDPKLDAKAYFGVVDRASNYTIDSIFYDSPNLISNIPSLHFEKLREYSKFIKQIIITNTEVDSLLINEIYLKKSNVFKIIDIQPSQLPLILHSNESSTIAIEFIPIAEYSYDDSLIIESDCYRTGFEISGIGVLPKIAIDDWFAGSIEVGKKVCYEDIYGQGMRIMNPGTDTLEIIAFDGIESPFSLSEPCIPPLPIRIPPNSDIYLKSICFSPQDTGSFKNDVLIRCNAGNEDTSSTWRGIAYTKVFVEDSYDNCEFKLKVIPNPSGNGKILITYDLIKSSNVTVDLYDNNSKHIEQLFSGSSNAGSNSISYLTNHLPSGIYYLILNLNEKKILKKLIINK